MGLVDRSAAELTVGLESPPVTLTDFFMDTWMYGKIEGEPCQLINWGLWENRWLAGHRTSTR